MSLGQIEPETSHLDPDPGAERMEIQMQMHLGLDSLDPHPQQL
jgi:hypothetical protein